MLVVTYMLSRLVKDDTDNRTADSENIKMSEVMKKSRIVSNNDTVTNNSKTPIETNDQCALMEESVNGSLTLANDDLSLQDLIDAELNSRLSNLDDTEAPAADSQECMISLNNAETDNLKEVSTETHNNVNISKSPDNIQCAADVEQQQTIIPTIVTTEIVSSEEVSYGESKTDELPESNECNMKSETFRFIENEKTFSTVTEDDYRDNLNKADVILENPDAQIGEECNDVSQMRVCEPEVVHDEEGKLSNATLNPVPNVDNYLYPDQNIEVHSPESEHAISDSVEVDGVVLERSSIKDKLMLGSDEKMALLFSQTITSPAFTPTDENFDLLEAIKHEESPPDFVQNEDVFRDNNQILNDAFVENEFVQQTSDDVLTDDILDTRREIAYDETNRVDTADLIVDNKMSDAFELSNGEISPENEREFSQESEPSDRIEEQTLEDTKITCFVTDEVVRVPDDTNVDERNNFDTANNIEIVEHVSKDREQESCEQVSEDGEEGDAQDPYRISNNKFLINDRKTHADDSINVCTNSATLVMNIQNSTKTTTTTTTFTSSETTNGETLDNKIEMIDNKSPSKKKKSKKSRKDNEKENISVSDECFIEDDLSQVNVKTLKETYCQQSKIVLENIKKSEPIITTGISIKELCRSFGDLTSISDENSSPTGSSPVSPKNSADSRAKSMSDLRYVDSEPPFYTGVSVKALCASFMNLANTNDTTNNRYYRKSSFKSNSLYRSQSLTHPHVKSSFSKFDALSKKTVLHVRSSDAGKAQDKFIGSGQVEQICKSCGKQVFQMEQIKAEKSIWHKNCFRCKECNKQLNVDSYESHESELFCKQHFKALFAPKVVEETQPTSDKPDLGLEELQSLNVKSRFQVFEHSNEQENQLERTPSNINVKRSPSILSKLVKFQSKGMDIGVTDDSLNGIPVEESSEESEESEDDGIEGEDADLIRAKRKTAQKEQPVVFDKLSDLKSKWESGNQMTKEERREERKQEIQNIRSRLFLGKQGKMKEMYQQAVMESESGANIKKQIDIEVSDKTKNIKDKFEKGETETSNDLKNTKDEDMSVFDAAMSKKSRSLFLELDANADKAPQITPSSPVKSQVNVKQARETNSPDREIYRDPEIVRSDDVIEDSTIAEKSHTASKMLSLFRQMVEQSSQEPVPTGPKPLKRFTPPPEPQRSESESEEDVTDSEDASDGSGSENDEESGIIRGTNKTTDEYLIQAQKAARAKQLRAKFERWETSEIEREQKERNSSSVNLAQECSEEQIESAKALRAKFESMRETNNKVDKQPRIKVNRFVEFQLKNSELCDICEKKVYPLEKIDCDGRLYHKKCFRCLQCNTVLRMDSYTFNQGMLYCIPHFKQLFITKGNYESGFGLDQHKTKWEQQITDTQIH